MKTRPAFGRDRKAAVGLTLAAAAILAGSVQRATSPAASDDGWRTALTIRSKPSTGSTTPPAAPPAAGQRPPRATVDARTQDPQRSAESHLRTELKRQPQPPLPRSTPRGAPRLRTASGSSACRATRSRTRGKASVWRTSL